MRYGSVVMQGMSKNQTRPPKRKINLSPLLGWPHTRTQEIHRQERSAIITMALRCSIHCLVCQGVYLNATVSLMLNDLLWHDVEPLFSYEIGCVVSVRTYFEQRCTTVLSIHDRRKGLCRHKQATTLLHFHKEIYLDNVDSNSNGNSNRNSNIGNN
jgi:hypothetical protein